MKPTDTPQPQDTPEADNAAGAGCMARLVRESLTLQQVWDSSHPGCIALGYPFDRPVMMARVVVTIKGHKLSPHRLVSDGKVFRADVFLQDGRTLRLLLPPDSPCEDLHVWEKTPEPDFRVAGDLGFGPRDTSRAVRDSDRLVLDLSANAIAVAPPTQDSNEANQ